MSKLEAAARQALESLEYVLKPTADFDESVCQKLYDIAITTLREALAEQAAQRCRKEVQSSGEAVCDCKLGECPEQAAEPAAFLANGTRFKISYDSRQIGGRIRIPPELGGRWVALVAAEDDCHLKLIRQRPPSSR